MRHTIVQTDCMSATEERDGVISVYVNEENGLDNGSIASIKSLKDAKREIYEIETPSSSSELEKLVLICTPEVTTGPFEYGLENFYNKYKDLARGYRLKTGDIFSVTKEAFYLQDESSDLSIGDDVYIGADGSGYKMFVDVNDDSNNRVGTMVVGTGTVGSENNNNSDGIMLGTITNISTLVGIKYYTIEITLQSNGGEGGDDDDDYFVLYRTDEPVLIDNSALIDDISTWPTLNNFNIADNDGDSCGVAGAISTLGIQLDDVKMTINDDIYVITDIDDSDIYAASNDNPNIQLVIVNGCLMITEVEDEPDEAQTVTILYGSYDIEISIPLTGLDKNTTNITIDNNVDIEDTDTYPVVNTNWSPGIDMDNVVIVVNNVVFSAFKSALEYGSCFEGLFNGSTADDDAFPRVIKLFDTGEFITIKSQELPEKIEGEFEVTVISEKLEYTTIVPQQTLVIDENADLQDLSTWPIVSGVDRYYLVAGNQSGCQGIHFTINGTDVISYINSECAISIYGEDYFGAITLTDDRDILSPYRFIYGTGSFEPVITPGPYTIKVEATPPFDLIEFVPEQTFTMDNTVDLEDHSTWPSLTCNDCSTAIAAFKVTMNGMDLIARLDEESGEYFVASYMDENNIYHDLYIVFDGESVMCAVVTPGNDAETPPVITPGEYTIKIEGYYVDGA